MTDWSRRISSTSASLIASAYVMVRIRNYRLRLPRGRGAGCKNVFKGALRLGERLRAHELHRLIDLRPRVRVDLRLRVIGQNFFVEQLLLEARQWIVPPIFLDFFARSITVRIADPMTPESVRFGLD